MYLIIPGFNQCFSFFPLIAHVIGSRREEIWIEGKGLGEGSGGAVTVVPGGAQDDFKILGFHVTSSKTQI